MPRTPAEGGVHEFPFAFPVLLHLEGRALVLAGLGGRPGLVVAVFHAAVRGIRSGPGTSKGAPPGRGALRGDHGLHLRDPRGERQASPPVLLSRVWTPPAKTVLTSALSW
ncbi:hypothetical protein GCM10009678_65850 [Actinomadura kijaniata]